MTLPERIRRLRLEKGLSQSELAERSGVSQPTISTYESDSGIGHRVDATLRIAEALETSVQYLLTGTGPKDMGEIRGSVEQLGRIAAKLNESQLAALTHVARAMAD